MTVPDDVERRIRDEPLSAFLATAVDDRPHVAPVWYRYEDDHLWFFTGGQKLVNLETNPRVAVAIEDDEGDWVVLVRGTARTVDDTETRDEVADDLFATYLGDEEATQFRDETDQPTGTLVRVAVGSVAFREQ
jgi:PPOX class probable F420-dependent enzyme